MYQPTKLRVLHTFKKSGILSDLVYNIYNLSACWLGRPRSVYLCSILFPPTNVRKLLPKLPPLSWVINVSLSTEPLSGKQILGDPRLSPMPVSQALWNSLPWVSVSGPCSLFLLANKIWQEWRDFAYELRSQSSWFWVSQEVYPGLDVISQRPCRERERVGPPWGQRVSLLAWGSSGSKQPCWGSPWEMFSSVYHCFLLLLLPPWPHLLILLYWICLIPPVSKCWNLPIFPFSTLTPQVTSSSPLALNTIYMCMILKCMLLA